jgi:DNA-binding SARP family transcriptional activator/TolB-like protein
MLRLTTLGAVDLRDRHGHALRDVLAQPKRVALLAYLVVEGSRGPVSRDKLLALFWPESDEARARNALSQSLHHLRQALGPGVVESQGVHAVGVSLERLWCDATVFAAALERGDVELALDLYRGEFCPALFVSGAPQVEQWLDAQRRRLRGEALATLRTHADRLVARGESAAAARAARRALAMHPDDEADVRALLALLERSGDVSGALLAFREYEQRITDELDTGAAPETRRLVDGMRRRRDAAASRPEAGDAVPVAPTAAPAPPAEAEAAPRPPPRRRGRSIAMLAGAGVLVLAAVVVWRGRAPAPMPLDDNALATLPFTVRGDPGAAYLRDAMVSLLDARLDGAAGLRTIDPHAILAAAAPASRSAPPDPRATAALGRRLGARLFVLGEVDVSAGHIHLGASLYDGATGVALVRAATDADGDSLFRAVDALAGQLLAGRFGAADVRLTRVAALTTRSLDALRAYVDGERAYRDARYQDATDAFEAATRLDTAFALAWYRLAVVRDWAGGSVREAVSHAMANAASLAQRDRNLLYGLSLYGRFDDRNAERVYNIAVTQHPDDVDAWSFLGETRFHLTYMQGRSFAESREPFLRVLALDPGNPNALLHLARIAAAEDSAAELDSLARAYLTRHPDADRALEVLALRASARHDTVEQAGVVAQLARSGDVALDATARSVAAYAQDMAAAERMAPLFAEPKRTPFYARRGRALSADLALGEGRWAEAQRRLAALAAVEPDWATELRARFATQRLTPASAAELSAVREELLAWRVHQATRLGESNFWWSIAAQPQLRAYLLGLVSVRLGDTAAARDWAERLDRMPRASGDTDLAGDLAHSVRAEIAFAAGAPRRALTEIEQVHFTSRAPVMTGTLHSGAHERFLHAEILHAVGRDEEALRWYGSFPAPSGYDITYLAPAYLRRAEIDERLGLRADALASYRRAAALWRDCDDALRPLVAAAQRAIERLSAGS